MCWRENETTEVSSASAYVATFDEQFNSFYSSKMSGKEFKGECVEHKLATIVYQGGFQSVKIEL